MQNDPARAFLERAQESLAGVESEFAAGRYNNCANRSYYAAFQAAIAALLRAGLRPSGTEWGHDWVQSVYAEQLVNRRKLNSAEFSGILGRLMAFRMEADYRPSGVSRTQTSRVLRGARAFVAAIELGEWRS